MAPPMIAGPLTDVDHVATLLLDAVGLQGLRDPGAAEAIAIFRAASVGIERGELVRHAADLLADVIDASPAVREAFLWYFADLLFDWQNVATIEPVGNA
jgi:hypothetical protein